MKTRTELQESIYLQSKMKSRGVAYLLYFFLGGVSAHRFYIGKLGVIQLAFSLIGWFFLVIGWMNLSTNPKITVTFIGTGAGLLIIWAIWMLIDLFTIGSMVDEQKKH